MTQELIDSLTPETYKVVREGMETGINFLRVHSVADLQKEVDKFVQYAKMEEVSSCKKGCSFCCKIKVDAYDAEADLILDHCEKNNIPIDVHKLKRQANMDQETWMLSPDAACVFLKNNACSIYEVRPISCRKYHVASDPNLCNAVTNQKGQVQVIISYGLEGLASSLSTKCRSLPLPLALLNSIDVRQNKDRPRAWPKSPFTFAEIGDRNPAPEKLQEAGS